MESYPNYTPLLQLLKTGSRSCVDLKARLRQSHQHPDRGSPTERPHTPMHCAGGQGNATHLNV